MLGHGFSINNALCNELYVDMIPGTVISKIKLLSSPGRWAQPQAVEVQEASEQHFRSHGLVFG